MSSVALQAASFTTNNLHRRHLRIPNLTWATATTGRLEQPTAMAIWPQITNLRSKSHYRSMKASYNRQEAMRWR